MTSLFRHLAACFLCLAGLPLDGQDSPQQAPGPILQVHVNAVLVPVVVRDAAGHTVGDLKQDDFKVFDQGKLRPLSGFTIQENAAIEDAAKPAAGSSASTAPPAASAASAAAQPAAPKRFIVFLFDDRHFSVGDLNQVKQAATRMLDEPLADSDRAVVLSFLGINSGMTHARAPLQAAVEKLKATEVYRPNQHQCPDIDYYSADQILNKHSVTEYQIAMEKAADCGHLGLDTKPADQMVQTAAMLSLQAGDLDARETLLYLRDVVHTMSQFPGQRTLILVSPGFLSSSDDALTLESQILDLAAGSNVTISALDARGLSSNFVPASQNGAVSAFGIETGQPVLNQNESMRENQDIMALLADGTGGTFFHNSNDLKGGLKTLAEEPQYRYLLEFSLQDVKQNGTYHALKVEVDRKGLKLQARQGYFAPMPLRNKK